MPTVLLSSHFWRECSVPPREGRPGIRCGIVELVAGQMSGGWEKAEETTARASAQVEMKATVRAARLWMTAVLIRRNCLRGASDPGPTQESATAAPAAQLPAPGSVAVRVKITDAPAASSATMIASGASMTVVSAARTTVNGAVTITI